MNTQDQPDDLQQPSPSDGATASSQSAGNDEPPLPGKAYMKYCIHMRHSLTQ